MEYRRNAPARTGGRRKRRRSSRTLAFSIVILAVLGAVVAIYALVFRNREQTVEMSATPISTTSTYINTGDGLLYQTDGQIHFYHLTDSRKNYTYGTAASDIKMSGSEKMTAVYNDISLQVIGGEKPLTFTGKVEAVDCGENYLGVLRTLETGAASVLVVTVAGEEYLEVAADSAYIVDFGFYKVRNVEMLWVETLDISAGTPTTTISTYDLSKKGMTGVMQVQSQLVDALYMTSQSVFALGTNQIIRYTHDGNKEIYRHTIYGYRVIDRAFSDAPIFLMTPRGGDMHSVKILTLAEGPEPAQVETYLQLPTEGVAGFLMGGHLVVVSREKVYTYTLKGKLSAEANLQYPVDAAEKLTDRILLLSSGGIYYLATI